jgi:hypothetical protein
MKKLWLTYAWDDNKNSDVDFVAQELQTADIAVRLDRWDVQSGRRLWEQLDRFITDPAETDGWLIYATTNSLGSEPCKEELAYALQRALNIRGGAFPLMALFPATIDKSLIPSAISTRLYTSLKDTDWKERIVSGLNGRSPNISRPLITPYELSVHEGVENKKYIEIRPRAGSWSPFFCGILLKEKDTVNPKLKWGARGQIPGLVAMYGAYEKVMPDPEGTNWWCMFANNEATPSQSYYLKCDQLPSEITFGKVGERNFLYTF